MHATGIDHVHRPRQRTVLWLNQWTAEDDTCTGEGV